MVIVALLSLIVLILLFGAAAVRSWILGVVGLVVAAVGLTVLFGENGVLYTLIFLVVAGSVLGIWVNVSSGESSELKKKTAAHKARVDKAKADRDERRAKGIKWP